MDGQEELRTGAQSSSSDQPATLGRAPESDGNDRPLSTIILLAILTFVGFLLLLGRWYTILHMRSKIPPLNTVLLLALLKE